MLNSDIGFAILNFEKLGPNHDSMKNSLRVRIRRLKKHITTKLHYTISPRNKKISKKFKKCFEG